MSGTEDTARSVSDKLRERRREEAARWFVALQHAELSGRVLKSWKKWEAVPENREAFDAVERVWRLADAVPTVAPADAQERADDGYDGSMPVSQWQSTHARGTRWIPASRFLMRASGLAAAAAALVLSLQWSFPEYFDRASARTSSVVLETGTAEHKEIVFEDGSRIHLGAQTAVTANFTKRVRSVVLDRGEALFKVAHDPERPFQVRAGGGIITAVGTAFNVRHRQGDDVVVTVTEGVVDIAPRSYSAQAQADGPKKDKPFVQRLARGQEVTYDTVGNLGPIRVADPGGSARWRDGRLRYHSEPLRHVIQDVNRYSTRELILSDPAAGSLLYSGTVFEGDIDDWISGLERIYPEIEVVEDDERILLRMHRAIEPR